jgi:hypothetical protein
MVHRIKNVTESPAPVGLDPPFSCGSHLTLESPSGVPVEEAQKIAPLLGCDGHVK